jgi:hypothetical protein
MPKLEPAIVNMTVRTTTIDNRTPERPPLLVLTHAQRQEDCGDRETKERYVADDVVDGASRRSFSADVDWENPRQQLGDAVEAKENKPHIGPTSWRDTEIEPNY